jgi:hypothetical protein
MIYYVMKTYMISTLLQILDQVKQDEMGGTCSGHGE